MPAKAGTGRSARTDTEADRHAAAVDDGLHRAALVLRFDADRLVRDTVEGVNIGVEVKTTIGDTIRLDRRQVNLDTDLMRSSATGGTGGIIISTGAPVRAVGYRAYCFFCDTVDMRSFYLRQQLDLYGISTQRGKLPGLYLPPRP